jgi:ABC-type transport system involved in cytochrome bd biosynthesis fused ATPase/permease subunit
MDMFIFFLPYIVLGIALVVAVTVPVSIWLVGILLQRDAKRRTRRIVGMS